MIKFIRGLNFGYLLFIAGIIVMLVGYQNVSKLQSGETVDATGMDWLKGICVILAGVYLVGAGILKVYKAKPKKGKYPVKR